MSKYRGDTLLKLKPGLPRYLILGVITTNPALRPAQLRPDNKELDCSEFPGSPTSEHISGTIKFYLPPGLPGLSADTVTPLPLPPP